MLGTLNNIKKFNSCVMPICQIVIVNRIENTVI